jgi:hypothetical protein
LRGRFGVIGTFGDISIESNFSLKRLICKFLMSMATDFENLPRRSQNGNLFGFFSVIFKGWWVLKVFVMEV